MKLKKVIGFTVKMLIALTAIYHLFVGVKRFLTHGSDPGFFLVIGIMLGCVFIMTYRL